MRRNRYIERRLVEFDSRIVTQAYNFAKRTCDVEDYAQVGRMGALEALRKDPNANITYVMTYVKRNMINYYNRFVNKNPEEMSADEVFGDLLWGINEDLTI